jgi:hypothetical protein
LASDAETSAQYAIVERDGGVWVIPNSDVMRKTSTM